MNNHPFNKRVFTLATFATSVRDLFTHSDALHAAMTHHQVSHAFVEKIMLAVTQVNGCRYCSYAHTRMALKAGASEYELRHLVAGEFSELPKEEIIALAFAQHYAEQQGHYEASAWQLLEEAYGSDAAHDMLVYIRLISLANLYGNTFDALLGRLGGRPIPGSHILDEMVVLILGATGVPIGILITRVSPRAARFIFTRKIRG